MRSRVLAVFCCVVWLGALAAAGSASAQPSPDARTVKIALDQAVRQLNAQTSMPDGEKMAATVKPETHVSSAGGFDSGHMNIKDIARWLLWISIAMMLGMVLLHLRDNLWSFSRSRNVRARDDAPGASAASAASAESAARMERARGEADALAGQGDYAGAIHVLLLQTLEELRRRSGAGFAASLTSRELLRSLELPPEQRALFAEIIGRVEVSWFGPHEPDGEEYAACRRDFESLKRMIHAGGAA